MLVWFSFCSHTPLPSHFTCPRNIICFKKDTLLLLRFLGHLVTHCELLRLEKSHQIARKMLEEKIIYLPSLKFCLQLTLPAEPACSFAYDFHGSKLCTPITPLILWRDLSKFYTSNFPTLLILCTIQNICCTRHVYGIPNRLFFFSFTFPAENRLIINEPQNPIGLAMIVVRPGTCKYFARCSSFCGDYFNENIIAISRQFQCASKTVKCL